MPVAELEDRSKELDRESTFELIANMRMLHGSSTVTVP